MLSSLRHPLDWLVIIIIIITIFIIIFIIIIYFFIIIIIIIFIIIILFRVSQLSDIDLISRETDCLSSYVCKGIALACFYYARCLHEGYGIKRDETDAKKFYSRVRNGF